LANLAVIFVCLASGILLRRSGRFTETAPAALGTFVVFISLPALVLAQVPPLLATASLDSDVLVPISMPWIAFVVAFVAFVAIGRRLGWPRASVGTMVLTVGLGNTSFVGYPLIESLLGTEALRFAVLVDQPGSFLALSTLGVAAGTWFAGGRAGARAMLRRIVSFPPLVALVVAVIWGESTLYRPEWVLGGMLDKLAATLVPVALVAVGAQLRVDPALLRTHWRPLAIGLGLKLLVLPAVFYVFYVHVLSLQGLAVQVTILQSAMSPMITAAVLAAELGLDVELAGLMLGVGIPLSLVTVPLWKLLLRGV
jgi:predicted permease